MQEFREAERTSEWTAGDAIASAMLRETEAWARMQGELVCGMQQMWRDWLHRRCEAIEASYRTAQRIWDARTPAEIVQAQQDWLSGAMQRGADDIGSWAGGAASLARKAGPSGQSEGAPSSQTTRDEVARPAENQPAERSFDRAAAK